MIFSNFYNDESGAVTVDWVILTAAIVGIAIAVLTLIASGINTSANSSSTQVASSDNVSGLIGGEENSANSNIIAYNDLNGQLGDHINGGAVPFGPNGEYIGSDTYHDPNTGVVTEVNYSGTEAPGEVYSSADGFTDPIGEANSDGSVTLF